jgi:hypothetical protein
VAGFIKCNGCSIYISGARQADQTVPQVFPIEQNEHNHEDENAKLRYGMYQYSHRRYDGIEWAKAGFTNFNGNWFIRRIIVNEDCCGC